MNRQGAKDAKVGTPRGAGVRNPRSLALCLGALGALAAQSGGCTDSSGVDELKLGRRSRDAGPAVVIVDRSERGPATTVPEKEPNEDAARAQALPLPGAVRGRIDGAGDIDVYKVVVPAPGTLRVSVSGVDDADLVLELRQPGGEVLAASDNGGAKVAEGVPNLFVQPGPVLIVVREAVKAAPKPKSKPKKGAPPPQAPARTAP